MHYNVLVRPPINQTKITRLKNKEQIYNTFGFGEGRLKVVLDRC